MPAPPPRTPSPVHKRRRTQPPANVAVSNVQVPTSPNSLLRHNVRTAMAHATSQSARQTRMNEVFDKYRQRALQSARRLGAAQSLSKESSPQTDDASSSREQDSHEKSQEVSPQPPQKKEQEKKQEQQPSCLVAKHSHHSHHSCNHDDDDHDHDHDHDPAQSSCSHHDEPHASCTHESRHREACPSDASSAATSPRVVQSDVEPGIFPGGGIAPGCQHYSRNCWIKAACCNRYYPCRRCHDEAEPHEIDRHATQKVACVSCGHKDQPVASHCRQCGIRFARYFCHTCRFYDDRADASAYHCHKCGICRVGKGLGIDNFHCDRCGNCVPLDAKDAHPCRERSLDANCPICTHYLATSTDQVMFLKCGHSMHVECLQQHAASSYTCPICHKCLTDMSAWYKQLDQKLANEVMPAEYLNRRSRIFCYDCDRKSVAKYHFAYHKCAFSDCGAYNTRVLETLDGPPSDEDPAAAPTAPIVAPAVPVAADVDLSAVTPT